MKKMSHIRCPMCGLNKAISLFDPENLENDILVRQAIGKGYRQGFGFGPDVSVLGDEELTPKVKDRCLELLKLLIDSGATTQHEVMKSLNFGLKFYGSDIFLDWKLLFDDAQRQLKGELNKNQSLGLENNSKSMQVLELIKKVENLEKKRQEKSRIDEILRGLFEKSESWIDFLGDDWVLLVNEIDIEAFNYLLKELYKLDHRMRRMVENRIITINPNIKKIFETFRAEPKIVSAIDLLLENPSNLYYSVHGLSKPKNNEDKQFTGFPDS